MEKKEKKEMSDAKYFAAGAKKGEIFQLQTELTSPKRATQLAAVKSVIAMMTTGKDVSALFPQIVNAMQTDNLELKKLCYLYLINYSRMNADLTIMAVNTFVKVCLSIRALLSRFFLFFCRIVSFFSSFFLPLLVF
jgi:AP-1 complex subunit beta-1